MLVAGVQCNNLFYEDAKYACDGSEPSRALYT